MYEFKLPVSGKLVQWKPLSVKVSIQIASQYPSANQGGFRAASLLGARIFNIGGDPRPQGVGYGEIGEWDDLDLEAFGDHVNEQETMRKMVLKKKSTTSGQAAAKEAFAAAIEEIHSSANRMSQAISTLLLATDAMKAEFDPLGLPPSST